MSFTPYHFGPNGFIGLALRRWLDIPVLVLANVIVDVEVLFAHGWPYHRLWHLHTLLGGAAVGVGWGLLAYPLKGLFEKIMQMIHLPYKTSLRKMLASGILGVWLHVFIDSLYHYDVQIFWPYRQNPVWKLHLLNKNQVKVGCIAFILAAVFLYVLAVRSQLKQQKAKEQASEQRGG
ncbi:MAG: metal-dependent hydrolase [Planctomycetota bacterium]|jgi:hypothetical protein